MQSADVSQPIRLDRRGDEVWARRAPGADPERVRLYRLRPLSEPTGAFSVFGSDRRELALVRRLEDLDPVSREVARIALDENDFMPRILKVRDSAIRSGVRTWEVDTDRGPRQFAMKDPNVNVLRLVPDRLLLRDTDGNRYEIASLAALDPTSRRKALRVL